MQKERFKEKKKRLEGIGGWLLVYVIMSFFSLFIMLLGLFIIFFRPDIFGEVVLSLFEILISLASFVLLTVAIVLIFMKRKVAITWNSIILGLAILGGIFLFNDISTYFEQFISFGRIVINGLWLGYWYKSERVRNTFVR